MEAHQYVKNRWRIFNIMLIGVVIAFCGGAINFLWALPLARAMFWVGWVVGITGSLLHTRQMVKETLVKPKDLYPTAKQPWEQ